MHHSNVACFSKEVRVRSIARRGPGKRGGERRRAIMIFPSSSSFLILLLDLALYVYLNVYGSRPKQRREDKRRSRYCFHLHPLLLTAQLRTSQGGGEARQAERTNERSKRKTKGGRETWSILVCTYVCLSVSLCPTEGTFAIGDESVTWLNVHLF